MPKQKRYSTTGGLRREDSDDELGYEDHPWQWIYEDEDQSEPQGDETISSRKRKANALNPKRTAIVGARMGAFSVRIGDSVLLKSPEQGKDWVGLACSFSETNEDGDDEMCVCIQWFCTPEELMFGKRSKISGDVLPNESYITADFNMNPLTAINGKATVLSKEAFFQKYPGGDPPKSKSAANRYAKTILCRRGVKQRTVRFTEDFVWEEIYRGPEDLLDLIDWIKEQTKSRKKQTLKSEDVEYVHQKEEIDDEPRTPHKRRKTTATISTPKSSVKASKYSTPTHKRIMIKKPIEITPLGTRVRSPSQYMSTPYSHARATLHVSAVPTSLPCRSKEFHTVYSHLYSAIVDGSGACIYISGTPGTGKTATVREVVASLHEAVSNEELDDFNFVEINGMKVTEPHQSYSLLWEALKGDRVSPHHALSLLEQEFSHPSPRRIPCVVLMDELDQLVTKNQSVMYNFFNWPAMRHSRLIVLAVANTMDLPERTLSNKISSRLGLTRITFPGYTHTQLMEIISSRLEGVPGNIVDKDAVQFASRKVAAVSGDARRALDICRRAVEIAEQSQEKQSASIVDAGNGDDTPATTPTRRGRHIAKDKGNGAGEEEEPPKRLARVTIATIKQAINEATSSPVAQHLRSLPLAAKLLLAAISARSRRTGIAESTMGDIVVEAKRIADVAENNTIHDFLLADDGVSGKNASVSVMPRILALGGAAMALVEAGVIAMELRSRGERAGKVRLRVGEEEVKSALMGDPDVKGLGF
ncbi:origin recognition complex subunit 1 [Cladophialophora psammophila CBS 110553]|uniref:Origin recognition complex subunit 1 n=1 Tax=Cladophialophora psammophila CBS 110553 TaxID=1182543 RepID=W9X3D3_9EURO|nr:origin recognition complex subunit 1 [Cladophialophora psammophila CBS 110553]EXJ74977.1 origin recognition complex subunit 1 [Cladophialophora psammophila CBS 110553]